MYYIIYKITNIHNNKFYIGSHQTLDLDDGYFGSGIYIRRALKKYGIDSFKKEILFYLDSKEEMLAKETEVLQQYKTDRTYNLKFCAMGGNTREKYNKKKKAAYIKKLIDNPKSPIGKRGKDNHMYGQKRSEEYCKFRSKQQKEIIKKLKQDPIKYKQWYDSFVPRAVEQCKKMSEMNSKKVNAINNTTGEILYFKSKTECAAYFKTTPGSITRILEGRKGKNKSSVTEKLKNYTLTN
jgi:group I intron endonuclease